MTRRYFQRYQRPDRINHWIVAICLFLAGLSGLALFHPSMYWFTNLFGGGPWTRILHPFLGVIMALGFARLFFRFRRDNVLTDADRQWNRTIFALLRGDKGNMPPAGKYNAGQKMMFWTFAISLLVLFVTGFLFWRPWFAHFFPITVVRLAVLLHAFAATMLVLCAIVHVYATIWVKGTLRAMTRGTVSEGWVRKNHPLWYRELTGHD